MAIGILGGSFDPVHNAHLIIAQLAREQLGLDLVRLVVSRQQPLKNHHGASAEQRLAMVKLAVQGLDSLQADGRELDRQGPSYTVDTLRQLSIEFPDAQIVLLLGADAAAELPQWHRAEEVARLAQISVFARGGVDPAAGEHNLVIPQINISSTQVRARAEAGLSLRGWVPEAVSDYISGLALYRTQGGAG